MVIQRRMTWDLVIDGARVSSSTCLVRASALNVLCCSKRFSSVVSNVISTRVQSKGFANNLILAGPQ